MSNGEEQVGLGWGLNLGTSVSLEKTIRTVPGRGIGIRLGPESGIIDIEVDGPEGEESLTRLFDGEVIPTLGWSSERDQHLIFNRPTEFDDIGKAVVKLRDYPGLELRIGKPGSQFQCACPPTPGCDGKPRKWDENIPNPNGFLSPCGHDHHGASSVEKQAHRRPTPGRGKSSFHHQGRTLLQSGDTLLRH